MKRCMLVILIVVLCAACADAYPPVENIDVTMRFTASPPPDSHAPPELPTPAPAPIALVTPRPTFSRVPNITSPPTATPEPEETDTPEELAQAASWQNRPQFYVPLLPLIIDDVPGEDEGIETVTYEGGLPELPAEANHKLPFLPEDMIAGELRQGMTQEEVIGILGLPETAYAYTDELFVIRHLELYYADGNVLEFTDEADPTRYLLDSVNIVTDLPGPRGIKIGDSVEIVFQSFRIDEGNDRNIFSIHGMDALYSEHYFFREEPPVDLPFAPSGSVQTDGYYWQETPEDFRYFICYDYPVYPYTLDEVESWEVEYWYILMHMLRFSIREGKVIGYSWGNGVHL